MSVLLPLYDMPLFSLQNLSCSRPHLPQYNSLQQSPMNPPPACCIQGLKCFWVIVLCKEQHSLQTETFYLLNHRVWSFDFRSLEFIWDLVLVIWCFSFMLYALCPMRFLSFSHHRHPIRALPHINDENHPFADKIGTHQSFHSGIYHVQVILLTIDGHIAYASSRIDKIHRDK